MDPLTHAISGAVLAKAAPRNPLSKVTVAWLALLAMAPDADYILRLVSDTFYLRHHRGVTHSVLMLPLWAWLFYALLPTRRKHEPHMPLVIGLVLASHILLDIITSFGTMMLAPFSDKRFAWDLVFIIDPFFTATLLVPLVFSLLWPQKARLLCIVGLGLMAAYLGLTYFNHQRAMSIAHQHHPSAQAVSVLPLPFSPFRWQLIASYADHETRAGIDFLPGFEGTAWALPDSLVKAYTGPLTIPESISWEQLVSMRKLVELDDLPGMAFYRWFARYPVLLRWTKNAVELGDLRFGAGSIPDSAFRLRIELGDRPKAWLLWGKRGKTRLQDIPVPSSSW